MKYILGNYHVLLTNRIFALPLCNDAIYNAEVFVDDYDEVYFVFKSEANIKINKDEYKTVNITQVICVVNV